MQPAPAWPRAAIVRFSAIAFTLSLSLAAPSSKQFEHVFHVVSFIHVTLGFLYAGKRFSSAGLTNLVRAVLAYACVAPCIYSGLLSIRGLFVIHSAFMDIYFFRDNTREIRLLRLTLNALFYFVLLRTHYGFPLPISVFATAFAIFLFITLLHRLRSESNPSQMDIALFEAMGLFLCISSLFIRVEINQVIVYHVGMSLFFPFLLSTTKGFACVRHHIYFLIPSIWIIASLSTQMAESLVLGLSLIHFITSMAFSGANPEPIRKFFGFRALSMVGKQTL